MILHIGGPLDGQRLASIADDYRSTTWPDVVLYATYHRGVSDYLVDGYRPAPRLSDDLVAEMEAYVRYWADGTGEVEPPYGRSGQSWAKMIAAKLPPPPDVLVVRRLMGDHYPSTELIMSGERDDSPAFKVALAAYRAGKAARGE